MEDSDDGEVDGAGAHNLLRVPHPVNRAGLEMWWDIEEMSLQPQYPLLCGGLTEEEEPGRQPKSFYSQPYP